MKKIETPFAGLYVFLPDKLTDARGAFYEGFHARRFAARTGVPMEVVQINHTTSQKNVLRGLHFQCPPAAQAKLIHVVTGKIMDVVVDLRQCSSTYGEHYVCIMEADIPTFLYIPKGFAHGFLVLSELAKVQYICDFYYSPAHERGIRYDDKTLSIAWGVQKESILLSEKDKQWQGLSACSGIFP